MSLTFLPLSFPSPAQGVWHLGPFPVRAYALCIIAGVVAAVWLGERRWQQRGGRAGEITDIALWAVPFGLVGARLYHVATDHQLYFPGNPVGALEVWHGGLGIWGGIAGGALGAWIVCRQRGIRLSVLADAVAPGLLLAQAIGRWGNYFNQELFGRPTTLPWALEIAPAHRPPGYQHFTTFHPTFLYESLWDLGAMAVVIWLDRRLKLGFGRTFALYVMAYTAGRGWIEELRIDTAADGVHFLGLRFNTWTSIILFVLALVCFVLLGRRHRGEQRRSPYLDGHGPASPASPATEEDRAESQVHGGAPDRGDRAAAETPTD